MISAVLTPAQVETLQASPLVRSMTDNHRLYHNLHQARVLCGVDTGAGPNASSYTLFNFQSNAPGTTTTVGTVTPSTNFVLESIAFQPTTVGSLGFTATQGPGSEGFTVGLGNAAFLNSTNSFQGGAVRDNSYSINLSTGAATSLGLIGGGTTFNTVDIAAFVVPEPGTYALCLVGLGAVAFGARRRRLTA